jgi:hypothetical protein
MVSSTFTYNTILTVFLHYYIQYHSYCLPPLLHTIPFLLSSSTFTYNTILTVFLQWRKTVRMVLYVKVEEDSKNGIVCKSGGRQ